MTTGNYRTTHIVLQDDSRDSRSHGVSRDIFKQTWRQTVVVGLLSPVYLHGKTKQKRWMRCRLR